MTMLTGQSCSFAPNALNNIVYIYIYIYLNSQPFPSLYSSHLYYSLPHTLSQLVRHTCGIVPHLLMYFSLSFFLQQRKNGTNTVYVACQALIAKKHAQFVVFEGNGFSFTPHTHTHTTDKHKYVIDIHIHKQTHTYVHHRYVNL